MTYCYTHRSVHLAVLLGEASSSTIWQWTYRSTTGQCTKPKRLWSTHLKAMLNQGLEVYGEENTESCKSQKWWKISRKECFLDNRIDACMFPQKTVTACIRPAQVWDRQKSQHKEVGTKSHPYPEPICNCLLLGKGKLFFFFPKERHWLYQPHSRALPMLRNGGQHKQDSKWFLYLIWGGWLTHMHAHTHAFSFHCLFWF